MIVYIDTGVFIDYLSYTHIGSVLRTVKRRRRKVEDLCRDAEECLTKITKSHRGITSCHTLYEAEGAMFSALKNNQPKGIAHIERFLITSAKSAITQTSMVADLFRIEIKDMTRDLMQIAVNEDAFSTGGVKLGDTLHLAMAMQEGAALVISGDKHILSLDNKLLNASGTTIRCVDTDEAKLVL